MAGKKTDNLSCMIWLVATIPEMSFGMDVRW